MGEPAAIASRDTKTDNAGRPTILGEMTVSVVRQVGSRTLKGMQSRNPNPEFKILTIKFRNPYLKSIF